MIFVIILMKLTVVGAKYGVVKATAACLARALGGVISFRPLSSAFLTPPPIGRRRTVPPENRAAIG